MKYVIKETMGIPVGILFSELLQHCEVTTPDGVISAGFCNVNGDTWGQSISLNKKPAPDDKAVILDSINRRC